MKRLSDYQGNEAIELWMDLIDSMAAILSDDEVIKTLQSGKPPIQMAKEVLKSHKEDVTDILLRIDPEPINGLNIVLRLISLISEIKQSEEGKSFFEFAEQGKKDKGSSGSAMVNTKAKKK